VCQRRTITQNISQQLLLVERRVELTLDKYKSQRDVGVARIGLSAATQTAVISTFACRYRQSDSGAQASHAATLFREGGASWPRLLSSPLVDGGPPSRRQAR